MRKSSTILTMLVLIIGLCLAGTASAKVHKCPDGSYRSNCGNPEPPCRGPRCDDPDPDPTPTGNTNNNTNTNDNTSNSTGINTNLNNNDNDATARVVDSGNSASNSAAGAIAGAGAISSVGDVGNNLLRNSEIGNNEASATQRQAQEQAVIQGQLGILNSDTTVDIDATMRAVNDNQMGDMTGTVTGSMDGNSVNGSQTMDGNAVNGSQTMGGLAVDSNDKLTIEGDELYFEGDDIEAPIFPVNTAAPVFAGNCAQGVSAQWMSGGGSIASGNPVCDFIAVAGSHIAAGQYKHALRLLAKAEKAADWRFVMSRIRMVITLGIL